MQYVAVNLKILASRKQHRSILVLNPLLVKHFPVRFCWKRLNGSIFQRKDIQYTPDESDGSSFRFYGPHLQNRYLRGVLDLSSERVK